MKILVVDDEAEIRTILGILLRNVGHTVIDARDGLAAVQAVERDKEIDLIIMDVMMPKLSGIDATAEIRRFSNVPILFLTAKSLDSDKEKAYAEGGDDYIVKPFSSKELLLKVDALTRRYNSYGSKQKTDCESIMLKDGVEIFPVERRVEKNGAEIDVKDRETDLLIYLAENRGRTVSPSELYEKVWGEMSLPSSNNTITVHILNLRRKLEDDPSDPKLIRTVWGRGYRID